MADAELRLGTVDAINATNGSLTVNLAGEVIAGVRWFSHYAPVVGDFIGVLRTGASGWFVQGKLSKNLGSPSSGHGRVTVTAISGYEGKLAHDDWFWQVNGDGSAGQGVHDVSGVVERRAGLWYLSSVASAGPSGSVITAAKLRITRWIAPAEGVAITPEAALVAPRLHMHAYTGAPSGAPAWTSTLWSPGTLAAGETGAWDLPSTWLTALLAGTARGIGVDSDSYADYSRFLSVSLELSYVIPL